MTLNPIYFYPALFRLIFFLWAEVDLFLFESELLYFSFSFLISSYILISSSPLLMSSWLSFDPWVRWVPWFESVIRKYESRYSRDSLLPSI